MKAAMLAFVLCCITVPVWAVVITPSNLWLPTSPGELFSFDLVVKKFPSSFDAKGCQSTVEVSGPGILAFNEARSASVSTDASYWLHGNSFGVNARETSPGSNKYKFGDGPNQGNGTLGANDFIVARYAFNWDGAEGLYRFTFDFGNMNDNYVLGLPPDYESYPLKLPQGNWYSHPIINADKDSFTVAIPEPTTLMLFVLGSSILLKKRKS
jgi:hypothetical protein